MKTNDVIYADTHAEFIRKTFDPDCTSLRSSVYTYDKNTIIWMVRFDQKNREGWRNSFINENELLEENLISARKKYDGTPLDEHLKLRRIVIAIDESGYRRKYIFKGVFVLNAERENTYLKHYFVKIADEIEV